MATKQDYEIYNLIGSGLTKAEVGRQFGVSPRTVGRRLIIYYNRSVRLGAHEVRPAPSTFTQMFARETNWYELDKLNSMKPPP